MRPMTKLMKLTTFVLATTAMVASAGAAAGDYYLKLGPVKSDHGSGKVREAAARAEVTSWSWGVSNTNSSPKGRVVGTAPAVPAQAAARPVPADYDGDGKADRVVSPSRGGQGLAVGKLALRPPSRGSVTLAGQFPGCTVGAIHKDALLQVAGARYRFEDVVITACGPAGGVGGTIAQSLSYSYLKRKLD